MFIILKYHIIPETRIWIEKNGRSDINKWEITWIKKKFIEISIINRSSEIVVIIERHIRTKYNSIAKHVIVIIMFEAKYSWKIDNNPGKVKIDNRVKGETE